MEQTLFGPILLEISEREILYYYSIFTCMCTYQDSQKNLSISIKLSMIKSSMIISITFKKVQQNGVWRPKIKKYHRMDL